tara:strand:+ start:146 stop:253 length:108 start_codon:yes stop_codon:yes gene_type:complete
MAGNGNGRRSPVDAVDGERSGKRLAIETMDALIIS